MEINGGEIIRNDVNESAMGGSEIVATALAEKLDPNLLKDFQIVNSRVRNLDESKVRIFVAHDLPGDPESEFLKNGGYNKFHKLVFVSNWQMQAYMNYYKIPWSNCIVMQNAIERIERTPNKPSDTIRLGYWSTPHRGLNILVPVFEQLCQKHNNIELDIYSSFGLYGWPERDKQYEELFNKCKEHPKINYHGAVPNEQIRSALSNIHILAYPSTWLETSCLVLMEAMAAGLLCVHPNYGALFETAANWTWQYQYDEDMNSHANIFYQILDNAITVYKTDAEVMEMHLSSQAAYAKLNYSWEKRVVHWNALLESLKNEDRALPGESFNYQVG